MAFSKRGDLYFTDPPHGLQQMLDDPEYLGWSGVYRIAKEALEAAQADATVVPEPELMADGAIPRWSVNLRSDA